MQRVIVIGARRVRQGTGEFLARAFRESGADVVGIVGTSDATVAEALRGLRERHRIEARGYTRLESALEAEQPDVVVIASPFLAHRAQLELVAAAGAHGLCEKPLWWPRAAESTEPDAVRAETERLVDLFDAKDRVLAVSTQWPMTLPAYFSLHPEARGEPVERFEMELGPASAEPAAMVLDAASHPLSLLLSLHGAGRVEDVRVTRGSSERPSLELAFDFVHATGTTRSTVRLVRCPSPPRPAAFGINGRLARREIRQPGYVQTLVRDPRSDKSREEIVLEDPLRLLVGRFLATIGADRAGGGSRSERAALLDGMEGLARLVAAASRIDGGRPGREPTASSPATASGREERERSPHEEDPRAEGPQPG